MPPTPRPPNETVEWLSLFDLLSLAEVAPWLQALDLDVRDFSGLRTLLLQQGAVLATQSPEAIQTVRSAIESEFGRALIDVLDRHVSVAVALQRLGAWWWYGPLERLAKDASLTASMPFDRKTSQRMAQLARKHFGDPGFLFLEIGVPEDPVEFEAFNRFGEPGPAAWVTSSIANRRVVSFLREATLVISSDQMARLLDWAKQQLDLMGRPTRWIMNPMIALSDAETAPDASESVH